MESPEFVPPYLYASSLVARGGSEFNSILVTASDFEPYEFEVAGHEDFASKSFSRWAASELLRTLGLAVPPTAQMEVCEFLIEHDIARLNGQRVDAKRPVAGTYAAFRAAPSTYSVIPAQGISRLQNREDFWVAWIVDALAGMRESSGAGFRATSHRPVVAYFRGTSAMFSGDFSELASPEDRDIEASRFFVPGIYGDLSGAQVRGILERFSGFNHAQFWEKVRSIPDSWMSELGLMKLSCVLNCFANSALIRNLLDEMIVSIDQLVGAVLMGSARGARPSLPPPPALGAALRGSS